MSQRESDSINLLDILSFLAKWRRVWIPAMLLCAIGVGIYAFTATPRFRSSAVVRGVENKSGGLGSLLASKLAGLGSIGGFTASLGEIRGDYYLMILRERSMCEKVFEKFDIRNRLELPDDPIEDVIDAWKNRVYFKFEAATNTVRIQVDDKDPNFAREVVEFYIQELDRRNRELESTKARKEREFAGNLLAEAKAHLFMLEDSMAAFQRESGIFNLEEQAKATVQAVAAVQAERFMAVAEYEMKSKLFTNENPELNLAKLKLASLDSSLKNLTGPKGDASERDFLLRLDSATEDGKTYLRLYREIEIHSILLALLTQQHEQAKMEEARNTPTMAVVEPASIGYKRVFPKRGMLVGIGAGFGLMIGLIIAGLLSTFGAMSSPDHPDHDKLLRFRRSWSGR